MTYTFTGNRFLLTFFGGLCLETLTLPYTIQQAKILGVCTEMLQTYKCRYTLSFLSQPEELFFLFPFFRGDLGDVLGEP